MKFLSFGAFHASLAALSFSFVAVAQAQDPVAVAPTAFKVLFENERVRVVEVQFASGVKNPMHSHPDYVIYPLTSYTMKSTGPDGADKIFEVKAGTVRWSPAVTHADDNVGTTAAHAILFELKAPAK
jgi:beta-alanine degradation protein BauB